MSYFEMLTVASALLIFSFSFLAYKIHKHLDAEGEFRVRYWYIFKLDTRTFKGRVLSRLVCKYMKIRGWTIL